MTPEVPQLVDPLLRRAAAAAGEELVRQEVCAEAVRLVRLVAEHPALGVPKAHALAALLLLQAARNPARVDPEWNLPLLSEQDRGLWDQPKKDVSRYDSLAPYPRGGRRP